jgi:hypothetical protein|tara:strand:- start:164 stop:550 length:387 start_codon:yes stop_codon:yes gene_type:complete
MINKVFLLFTAIMYGWLGGWALFDPMSYVDDVGLSINSNLGSAEIRSVYGGINLLIGLFSLIAIFKPKHQEIFFKVLIFIISGILLGRVVTLIYGEFTSAFLIGFTAFEVVYFIFLYLTLKNMKRKIF